MMALGIGTNLRPSPAHGPNTSLRRHVAEFEGMLLSQILEKLRDTYRMPGAEETDSAGESFQSLANSAMGNGLAANGGLGLTDLLVQSLTRRPETAAPVKDTAHSADEIPEVGGEH